MDIRQIAISIPPVSDMHNGIIRGILDYVAQRPDLQVHKQRAIPCLPLKSLRRWRGDGAIVYYETAADQRLATGLPCAVVSVSLTQPPCPGLPVVHSDSYAIGKLAAEHLLGLGLRRFAFVGYLPWYHNQQRWSGFEDSIKKAGFSARLIKVRFLPGQRAGQQIGLDPESLRRGLCKLTPPVGVLAAHDEFAHDVVELLRADGVLVPYDAAVMGVNNFRLICETTQPPLTSVVQAAESIGREAACLLDQLMRGGRVPEKPRLLPPSGIVARRSTDYLAIEDPMVLQAVRFIRAGCGRPITAADVCADVQVSRRTLDIRFIESLGHTAAEEIRLARLKLARELLTTTNMQVIQIGYRCGYESPSGFVRAFRQATGRTPEQFRRQTQAGADVSS